MAYQENRQTEWADNIIATKNVCFLIYDDMEALDFTGPHDVFVQANAAMRGINGGKDVFELFLVAVTKEPVTSSGGIRITPDFAMGDDKIPEIHTLVIPGTPGYTHIADYDQLTQWINKQSSHVSDMVSVCVGAFLMVGGLGSQLNGKQITTHHGAVGQLQDMISEMGLDIEVVPGIRYLADGSIYSSGGVSAGIDLGFYLVTGYLGQKVAARVANIMEYNRTINYALE